MSPPRLDSESSIDPEERVPITRLLDDARAGDEAAVAEVIQRLYAELKTLASSRLRGQSPGQTLRPTELVHEAYLKLMPFESRSWENRRHFMNSAGTAMRSVIVDRARARKTARRGGNTRREALESVEPQLLSDDRDPEEVLAIDEALDALSKVDARVAEGVTLRLYLGLPEAEIASHLGVTDRTVQRDWKFARAWLARALDESPTHGRATGVDRDASHEPRTEGGPDDER